MLNSPIDEIKSRLDIVEVVGSYIKLQKAGINYRALCPFHSEKKPSFFVSPARQTWHCFGGCSEGGNIFKFIMKIEGVEFGDALRILAQKAGVELKKQPPELKTERQRIYEISELATQFFERQLEAGSGGKEAKKYLLTRGISEDSIKKWHLGYAPDTWQGLSDFLVSKGYQKEEIEKAGLAIKNETGNFYDRFRGRIIFPIFDLNSQIIGFGGRVFGEKGEKEVAKYVNTPNTLLYDKSRVLYGLNNAKMAIRKKGQCILVEGYVDVIMSHQAGVENVVATSGTALTSFQLAILKRYSENLITAFDMDVAGDSATKRGIDLAQTQGFEIKVITMPEGKDPADIVLEKSEEWEKLVNRACSILDFYFQSAFSHFDKKSPEGKKEISQILLPVLKRIPNKIIQAHWIQKLARELEVKEEDVETELKKVLSTAFGREIMEEKPLMIKSGGRKEILEEKIVSLVFKTPENLALVDKNSFACLSPQFQKVLTYLKENPKADLNKLPQEFKDNSEFSSLLNCLLLKSEVEEEDNPKREMEICLKEMRIFQLRNKLAEFSKEIKEAEEKKDFKKVDSLAEQFNKMAQKIKED